MDEVYVSFECTAKLYFRGPQRPVEHRCRLTLGANRHQNGSSSCMLTVEGAACQRRTFKITKETVTNVAARLSDGCMTVVFRNSCCDSLVIKEVVNRTSLTLCHKIISGIWMDIKENLSKGVGTKFNTTPEKPVTPESSSSGLKSAKRKLQLNLGKRYGETRGGRMLEASQSKQSTTSSFYNSKSPVVASSEPFLPQAVPNSSPYFQRVTRRNLAIELSGERGKQSDREGQGSAGGKELTPRGFNLDDRNHSLGPRKAAIVAQKRLPLGDIFEQPPPSTLKDYLTLSNPSNREGFANLGNTCYMNAVLQVLLGLEPFAEDLLNFHLIKRVNSSSLCRMMYLLLKSKRAKDSYDSQKILLKKIKSVIESNRPKFSGYKQQDAHELLTQCLDQLKDDSKHIKVPNSKELFEGSLCPVVRNFECEMCRSITCKSCGKVTEVSELIYDFALQLPKSVLLRPNEQANLQDLMDAFFVSEEVEHKCPLCSCNSATMSCRLARLPRIMILFLKRYGYNANLSRNSKRIDFIRIPRFIRVGHLCSEKTKQPSTYSGPWPREATATSMGPDDKENLPSSGGINEKSTRGNIPPEPAPLGSVSLAGCGVLGKRQSSEDLEDVMQETLRNSCDVMKKQKLSVSDSVSTNIPVCASNNGAEVYNVPSNGDSGPPLVNGGGVVPGTCLTAGSSTGSSQNTGGNSSPTICGGGVASDATPHPRSFGTQDRTASHPEYSQSSVGREIAAEFDALFSPEVIFEFENNSSFTTTTTTTMTTTPTTTTTPAMTTDILDAAMDTSLSVPVTTHVAQSADPRMIYSGCVPMQREHPLPTQTNVPERVTQRDKCTPGLFGGVACAGLTHSTTEAEMRPEKSEGERAGLGETNDEEEVLKRALEESMRDQQSSDVMLLQQMGLSEDEQLELALELSMQEQSAVEECGQCPVEPSSEHVDHVPTPDTHQPETYKLMGIVNHIGKSSSGGHYISDLCSAEGVWHSYNDCHVNEVREEDIRQRRQRTGYIFFYMHKSILGSLNSSNKRSTQTKAA